MKVAYYIFQIYYHTSFQDPILCQTTVTPTTQICASIMLLSLITGYWKQNRHPIKYYLIEQIS